MGARFKTTGKSAEKREEPGRAKKKLSRSARANLQFPVSRIHRFLKKGNFARRISSGTSVFLAAAAEYLVAEIVEMAGQAAIETERARINQRHLTLALLKDIEFKKLFRNVTIVGGGVLPYIHDSLLPKKPPTLKKAPTRKKAAEEAEETTQSDN